MASHLQTVLPLAERTDVLRAPWEVEERLKRDCEFMPHSAGSEAMCCSLQQASKQAAVPCVIFQGGGTG